MNIIKGNDAGKATAHIYNSAVAASAISAAWELGALDELNERGVLDAREFATSRRLDLPSTLGMLRALAAVDVIERDDTKVVPAANFDEVYRTRSFFHWLARGSAELFRQMPTVLRTENRIGDFYQRDSAAIAFACREINTFCYDPWFWKAIDGLDFDPTVVADLGCGSGERVMQILRHYSGTRGLGIDIARPSLEVAAVEAENAGLADRVIFLEADVLTMERRPAFTDVELLTCFMMGHDFWPRRQCVNALRHLSSLFPNVRRFLLGDATRTDGVADRDLPVFTLGFELAHDMMGAFLPTIADWESVFEEGGWRLLDKHWINIAVGEVIFELCPISHTVDPYI
ncbi:MAG: SAM-dependent methyltransferase [Pseudonocardiaceae bacterium]